MLFFKFEDVLLTAVVQRSNRDIWTLEQLSKLRGPYFSMDDLAFEGDICSVSRDLSPVSYWRALFDACAGNTQANCYNFTLVEQEGVIREVRRIISAELPWLSRHRDLLEESIALTLSTSFLVWLRQRPGLPDSPNLDARPTLFEFLRQMPLAN